MSDRRSVRAELERKRIQLAQMREERERRSRLQLSSNTDENTSRDTNNDRLSHGRAENADDVLDALGLSASLSRSTTAPSNVSSLDQYRLQSPDTSGGGGGGNSASFGGQFQHEKFSASLGNQQKTSTPTIPFDISTTQSSHQKSQQQIPLQVVHVNQINIAPKELVYYSKSTQTAASQTDSNALESGEFLTGGSNENLETPQQKSYYGKQSVSVDCSSNSSQLLSPSQNQQSTKCHQQLKNTKQNSQTSVANQHLQTPNTNHLALEWDDEFPGT